MSTRVWHAARVGYVSQLLLFLEGWVSDVHKVEVVISVLGSIGVRAEVERFK